MVLALALVSLLPRGYRWALTSAVLLVAWPTMGVAPLGSLFVILAIVCAASLVGAGLQVVARGGPRHTRLQRAVAWAGLVLGGVTIAAGLVWMLGDGSVEKPLPNAMRSEAAAKAALLDLPDPSQPGRYAVRTLTYGSGTDRRRAEFGAGASLRTRSVDGSPFIERWSGPAGWARTRYWGFDATQLPIQGRVYYPEGAGPFPLVLLVHGNHQAARPGAGATAGPSPTAC
jgi:hypothetical protein